MENKFICRECKEEKDTTLAKKGSVTQSGIGKCKACHSIYSANKQIVDKAMMFPHLYMECDECDRTFSIYQRGKGRPSKFIAPPKNTCCPYCSSEEIRGFLE